MCLSPPSTPIPCLHGLTDYCRSLGHQSNSVVKSPFFSALSNGLQTFYHNLSSLSTPPKKKGGGFFGENFKNAFQPPAKKFQTRISHIKPGA